MHPHPLSPEWTSPGTSHGYSPHGGLRISGASFASRPDWASTRVRGPDSHGRREWSGERVGDGNGGFGGGLRCSSPHILANVRPCDRRRWHPVFLGRRHGGLPIFPVLAQSSPGLARGSTRGESSLLLCRGDRTAQSQSGSSEAWSGEASLHGTEGHHSNLVPTTSSLERDHPCFIIISGTDAEETGGVRSSFAVSGITSAISTTPERFWGPSSDAPPHSSQSRQVLVSGWSSPQTDPSTAPACPEEHARGRASRTSRGAGAPHRRSRSGVSDAASATASTESPGLPYSQPGWASRPRVDLCRFFCHFFERLCKKGEVASRAGSSKGGFLPQDSTERFPKTQTLRSCSRSDPGVPEEGHLHKIPGEARRIHGLPTRFGAGYVASFTCGRPDAGRRSGRSAGDAGISNGRYRTKRHGRGQVGGSMDFVPSGGPSHSDLLPSSPAHQSTPSGVWPPMPGRLGRDSPGIRQGAGPVEHPQVKDAPKEARRRSTQAGGRRSGDSQAKATPIPQASKESSKSGTDRGGMKDNSGGGPKRSLQKVQEEDATGSTSFCSEEPQKHPCQAGPGCNDDLPSWTFLQTFSFSRWTSSLCRLVLASHTPFAEFLKRTLHITRSSEMAPEKALFPLPLPKEGVFTVPSRAGGREKEKVL